MLKMSRLTDYGTGVLAYLASAGDRYDHHGAVATAAESLIDPLDAVGKTQIELLDTEQPRTRNDSALQNPG